MDEDADLLRVTLRGLPLHLRAAFVQHADGLLRELALVRIGAGQHPEESLPPRLLEVAAELGAAYAPFAAGPEAAMEAALAAGEDSCDVTYVLPRRIVPALEHLAGLLEEADDFCRREEHLLTLPASPDVVAYRRWAFGEFQRQLRGQEPRPWPGSGVPGGPAPGAGAAPPPHAPPPHAQRAREAAHTSGGPRGQLVGQPLVMDALATGVAAARRHVRGVLAGMGAGALEESAELGVSELVTNAMLHARTAFTVTVRAMSTGRVRIEISDSSPVPVQLRRFGAGATTGRGLRLVASLSHDWGVDERTGGPGKTVWFEPQEATAETALAAQDWAIDLQDLL